MAIDLRKMDDQRVDVEPVEGGPLRPVDTLVMFSLLACWEMEAAVGLVRHVALEEGAGCGSLVALYLPVGKTEILRRQGCLCHSTPKLC